MSATQSKTRPVVTDRQRSALTVLAECARAYGDLELAYADVSAAEYANAYNHPLLAELDGDLEWISDALHNAAIEYDQACRDA